jgi:tetratricopeptide (TPR) repeat protein
MIRHHPASRIAVCLALSSAHVALPARAEQLDARSGALIQRGDQLYSIAHGHAHTLWKAIGFYREALKAHPASFDVLWRLGRAFQDLGERSRDKSFKRQAGQQGLDFALKAIQQEPRRVEGHFWAALCVGVYGDSLGMFSALRQRIQDRFLRHLETALRIDPSYDHGAPDRVYGIYHRSLPWPLRSYPKAIDRFRRSLRYDPNFPLTHMYLGQTLLDTGEPDQGREHLRACVRHSRRLKDLELQKECGRLLAGSE